MTEQERACARLLFLFKMINLTNGSALRLMRKSEPSTSFRSCAGHHAHCQLSIIPCMNHTVTTNRLHVTLTMRTQWFSLWSKS